MRLIYFKLAEFQPHLKLHDIPECTLRATSMAAISSSVATLGRITFWATRFPRKREVGPGTSSGTKQLTEYRLFKLVS